MAWDLVLDPALPSAKMSIMHFWIWKEHGAYDGIRRAYDAHTLRVVTV